METRPVDVTDGEPLDDAGAHDSLVNRTSDRPDRTGSRTVQTDDRTTQVGDRGMQSHDRAVRSGTPTVSGQTNDDQQQALLPKDSSADFERRWQTVQARFVEQPRDAVREAETLVGDLVDRLTKVFSSERERLEGTWSRGEDVSTEDLRIALQRYRSFFRRLLAT